jgi:hypothetical protein
LGPYEGQIEFFEISESGLSTTNPSVADSHVQDGLCKESIIVPLHTLAYVCEKYVSNQTIHFLKIDVEGAELSVLQGADFKRYRPWILIIESTKPKTQIFTHSAWEPIVLAASYSFVYGDGLNRFYLANEYVHLQEYFQFPPNVFDNFVRFLDMNTINISLKALLKDRVIKRLNYLSPKRIVLFFERVGLWLSS